MSIYSEANSNPKGTESTFLGPSYNYKNQIKKPAEMGMGGGGSMKTLSNNVTGLMAYTSLLADGGGKASKVNGPLGNKYFMNTGATCTDVNTKKDVARYIYINNIPNPPLPGLIKGVTTGLDAFNPFRILGAFSSGSKPPCKEVTLEVVDVNNRRSQETHFVTLTDINALEGFQTYNTKDAAPIELPDNVGVQFYFATLSCLGLYIMYRIMKK